MIDFIHATILVLYFIALILLILTVVLKKYRNNRVNKLLIGNCTLIFSLLLIKGVLMIAELGIK